MNNEEQAKIWRTIFKLDPPICGCGNPMKVLEVIIYGENYLILRANDILIKPEEYFYTLYSIEEAKVIGGVYTSMHKARFDLVVKEYENQKEKK